MEQTEAANQVLHLATEKAQSARAAEQMCDEQKMQAAEQKGQKKSELPLLALKPKAAAPPPPSKDRDLHQGSGSASASAGGAHIGKDVERKRLIESIRGPCCVVTSRIHSWKTS